MKDNDLKNYFRIKNTDNQSHKDNPTQSLEPRFDFDQYIDEEDDTEFKFEPPSVNLHSFYAPIQERNSDFSRFQVHQTGSETANHANYANEFMNNAQSNGANIFKNSSLLDSVKGSKLMSDDALGKRESLSQFNRSFAPSNNDCKKTKYSKLDNYIFQKVQNKSVVM